MPNGRPPAACVEGRAYRAQLSSVARFASSKWFRAPSATRTRDSYCHACDTPPRLSKQERARLKRQEQDIRGRLERGYRLTDPERAGREHDARRAALLGLSRRQYQEASRGLGLETLLWYPAYLVSATLVGTFAIVHGLTATPPELLPIPVTIMLLCGWLLFWIWFVEPANDRYDLELRAHANRVADGLFAPVLVLIGLLLPVLTYMLVRVVVRASWP